MASHSRIDAQQLLRPRRRWCGSNFDGVGDEREWWERDRAKQAIAIRDRSLSESEFWLYRSDGIGAWAIVARFPASPSSFGVMTVEDFGVQPAHSYRYMAAVVQGSDVLFADEIFADSWRAPGGGTQEQ